MPAATSCGDPGVPPNAVISGGHSWTYGSVVQYSCLLGGLLVGSATRHCQEDGTWSGAPPYCTGEHTPGGGLWAGVHAGFTCGANNRSNVQGDLGRDENSKDRSAMSRRF